ncbi:uncharacterized protein LOC141939827 isoform X2 [Strix uralensis]|uniref:uncharacterized protein LOC141939827 isoform X2 n=1 Tax=Strix uralensis TaxID=36305 RepID=UPI003DA735B0
MGHLESNAQPSSATQKWPLNTGIPGLLRDSAMALWYLITKVTGPARSLLQCRGLHRITASFRAHPPAPAWGPPRAAETVRIWDGVSRYILRQFALNKVGLAISSSPPTLLVPGVLNLQTTS